MFYSDKPIISNEDDLLNRKGFARLLAKSLLYLNRDNTFTVGLFGKWGSGKSSLVNMSLYEMEHRLKETDERKVIIIRFEPWHFSDSNQLLTQFFVRMSNEFRSKGDKNLEIIGDALERYSDAFEIAKAIPIFGGLISSLGKHGTLVLGKKMKKGADNKDILKQKEHVVSLLEKQDSKIIVVIDDIDRLSNEQICQVFQLITAVADFPNTTYLVIFDKEIVVKALEKVQEGNGEEYLEKVIQMPIQLPDIQKGELRQVFFTRIAQVLSEHNDVFFSRERWQRVFESCIDPYINNLRDVNRLCNIIQFKLTTIAAEVDFTDMVAISILEVKFPKVYEWIKVNKPALTGAFDALSYRLYNKPQKECYEYYKVQLLAFLQNEQDNSLVGRNIEDTIDFLSRLFPYFGQKIGKVYETYNPEEFRKNNQISHPEKFDRYFHLNPEYIGTKKEVVLSAAHSLDCESFKTLLMEMDRNGLSYEFLEDVMAMLPDISADRAEIIAKAFVEISSQLDTISNKSLFSLSTRSYAQHKVLDLIDKLPSADRMTFFMDLVQNATSNSMEALATVINMLELGYGRLAAKGVEKDYKKVISLDDLLRLETLFCKKIKGILKATCLFSLHEWRMTYYLLECFEPEYLKIHIEEAFKDKENILRYLENTVTVWTGSGTGYEITDEYLKHLTKEQIINAIQEQVKTGAIYTLPEKVQYKCAAFILNDNEKQGYNDHISQADVNELIEAWKLRMTENHSQKGIVNKQEKHV